MNFTTIAFLDTHDLACSAKSRIGMFRGEGGRKMLPLRGPRKDAGDPDDEVGFILSREATRWPELKTMLSHIERSPAAKILGGIEFGRVYGELLMPGMVVPWAKEETPYALRHDRLHLALRTNPAATLFSGTESYHVAQGYLTAINRRLPCSAMNMGEWPRLHLIIDFKRKSDPSHSHEPAASEAPP